jgi:PAS domain S-box-containing protein
MTNLNKSMHQKIILSSEIPQALLAINDFRIAELNSALNTLLKKELIILINNELSENKKEIINALQACGYYHGQLKIKESIVGFTVSKVNTEHAIITFSLLSEKPDINLQKELDSLFENNLTGVFKSTLDGVLLSCNQALANMLGYKDKEQLIGCSVTDLYFDKKQRSENMKRLSGEGNLQNQELKLLTKSGKPIWVLENVSIIKGDKGEVLYQQGSVIDISTLKQTQDELNQNIERYKSLLDNIPDAIIIHKKGIIQYLNPGGEKLFDVSSDSATGISVLELFSAETAKQYAGRLKAIYNYQEADYHEFPAVLKNGKKLFLAEQTNPIIYRDQEAFQTIISNLSFRKQWVQERMRAQLAEEINEILKHEIREHKITQQQLEESRNFNNSLIESSIDIIIAVDDKGVVTTFNTAAEQEFGYSRKEVIGVNSEILYKDKSEYNRVISGLHAKKSFRGEIENKRKSGQVFTSYLSASRLYSESGDYIGSMGVSRDISRQKRDAEELKNSEERYRELFNTMSDAQLVLNEKDEVVFCNKAGYKLLGISTKSKEQINFASLIATEDKKIFKDSRKQIIKTGKPILGLEYTIINRKNESRQIEVNTTAVFENKKFVGTREMVRDITDKKRAEDEIEAQAAKIKAIFESGNHLFWTVNKNIALTSFNKNYEQAIFDLYGVRPEINKDPLKPRKLFASKDYHGFWQDKYELVFKGVPQNFETNTLNKNGERIFRDVFLNPIYDKKGHIVEVSGIAHDITDKKLAERKVQEQAARIKSIFESSAHLIWSINKAYELTSYNQNFVKAFSGSKLKGEAEINLDVRKTFNHLSKQEAQIWKERYEKAFAGVPQQFELCTNDSRGSEQWFELFLNPIFDEKKQVIELSGIGHHITFKKQAERKIKDQAAKINSIFESTAMLIWTLDHKMRITSFNENFAKTLFRQFGVEVQIGLPFPNSIEPFIREDLRKEMHTLYQKALDGKHLRFEAPMKDKSGNVVWVESFLNPIFVDNDKVFEISCLSHEITDKKVIEKQVRESLREKEILLQEVHHRVKNNLQVISSILNLQSSYVKDKNTLNILRESQNRIKSMSFIHESLYQTKDFSSIDFADYILSLSNNLIHSYNIGSGTVRLDTDFEKVFLNLDQAIPCGLIVNELLSNALKYAFTGNKKGVLNLSIKEKQNKVYLRIKDNGVGLPPEFKFEEADSLGLQLVFTLIEQLDGEVKFSTAPNKGTDYLITFEKLK